MNDWLLAFTIVASLALLALIAFIVRKLRAEEQAREVERERKKRADETREKTELKDKIAAGTHLDDGRPRCLIAPCPHAATEMGVRFARDEHSVAAWTRAQFGAPPRLRIVRGKKLRYCLPHEALITARFRHELAKHEEKRAAFLATEDAVLADFEHAVDTTVSQDLLAKREAASIPPPPKDPP